MERDTLTITDNQTGKSFEIAVENRAIAAAELIDGLGRSRGGRVAIYDPGFANTAPWRSAVTNIHVEQGLLEHRGYRIEELCEHSSYIELSYLLIHGELPTAVQFDRWSRELSLRKFVHENVKTFLSGFPYDAHPMAMLAASVGALSSFYSNAGDVQDAVAREQQILRLLAKMPTLAAFAYRRGGGQPYVHPDDELGYAGNLLAMMFRMSETRYRPDPRHERALEVLLMVHADHEMSAAATAVRAVGSTSADPYAAVAAGVAALSAPARGSADREVLEMLRRIGSPDQVAGFLERIKGGDGRLSGFGHLIYRTRDPRAAILRRQLDTLYEDRPTDPLIAVADELAQQVAADEYFTERRMFANIDLYSGLTYQAIGVPQSMFGVMFALARTAGWLAQWNEMVQSEGLLAVRPRQLYIGSDERLYVPLAQRG